MTGKKKDNEVGSFFYEDKKLTVAGSTYKVTLLFPMPDSGTDLTRPAYVQMLNDTCIQRYTRSNNLTAIRLS